MGIDTASYLKDHKVQNLCVLSGAAYLEAVLAAASHLYPGSIAHLEHVQFHQPLILAHNSTTVAHHQLVLRQETDTNQRGQHFSFQYCSRALDQQPDTPWTIHATGTLLLTSIATMNNPETVSISAIKARCTYTLRGSEEYARLQAQGIEYGPAYQGMLQLWGNEQEVLAQVQVPDALRSSIADEQSSHLIHPAFLDACLHASMKLIRSEASQESSISERNPALPVFIEKFRLYHDVPNHVWSHVQMIHTSALATTVHIQVLDTSGNLIMEAEGTRLQRLEGHFLPQTFRDWLYTVHWLSRAPNLQSTRRLASTNTQLWCIFADTQDVGKTVSTQLSDLGIQTFLVFSGISNTPDSDSQMYLAPDQPAKLTSLMATLADKHCQHILYLCSAEYPPDHTWTTEEIAESSVSSCAMVMHLVQHMVQTHWQRNSPHLWIATRGAQIINTEANQINIAQAPLWGFGRGIAEEHAPIRGGLIDVDPQGSAYDTATQIRNHIQAEDRENLAAFRHGQRYVARLEQQPFIKESYRKRPGSCHCNSYSVAGKQYYTACARNLAETSCLHHRYIAVKTSFHP